MVPSQQHADWHRDMSLLLSPRHPSKPIERREVTITIYAPDCRAGDLTNKAESIMDPLVDTGFLKDDNWFVAGDNHLRFGGVDRERSRAVVRIEPAKQNR